MLLHGIFENWPIKSWKGKPSNVFAKKMYQNYWWKSWKRMFWKGKNIICLHCAAFGRDRRHCRLVPRSDSVSREWWCSSYSCCNSSPPSGSWTETEEIDWLIKGNWSCYSTVAANSSHPAGLWTETKEIDRLKEKVVLQLLQLVPSRRLVDWKKMRLIDRRKMLVLHVL